MQNTKQFDQFEADTRGDGGRTQASRGLMHRLGAAPGRLVPRSFQEAQRWGAERGFSLIEIVVVVIIIGVLAVIAIPNVTKRMRDRRTNELAQRVALTYRDARMRAMGRGSAVMVRYTAGTAGSFEIREGVVGTSGTCADMPSNGCNRLWNETDSRSLTQLNVANRAEYADNKVLMKDTLDAEVAAMDVCYTPMGRAFVRYDASGAFQQLTGVPSAGVSRYQGSSQVGLERRVVILPNGTSRLGL